MPKVELVNAADEDFIEVLIARCGFANVLKHFCYHLACGHLKKIYEAPGPTIAALHNALMIAANKLEVHLDETTVE